MFKQITIIGAGLIGGSLALALKKARACEKIVAISRNELHLREAVSLGVIDDYALDMATAVHGSELIFISTPVGSMKAIFSQLAECLNQDVIITDAGSSKSSVVADAQEAFGILPTHFVPGHPIAGAEYSGVSAAFATLYENHKVILTPVAEQTASQAVDIVQSMWEITGASVSRMSPKHHDDILAMTSHLPHLLAFGLVDGLAQLQDAEEIFQYAAGGFRDFTRIASSDPTMWRDICVHNQQSILDALSVYQNDLDILKNAIKNKDADTLSAVFSSAQQARDQYIIKK